MLDPEMWLWTIRTLTSIAGLSLGGIGAWKAYREPNNRTWSMINTLVWSVGPPIWFAVEYTILYPLLDGNPAHKEDLRHGQDLGKAFWAGIGAILIALYKMAENDAKKLEGNKSDTDRSADNNRMDQQLAQMNEVVTEFDATLKAEAERRTSQDILVHDQLRKLETACANVLQVATAASATTKSKEAEVR